VSVQNDRSAIGESLFTIVATDANSGTTNRELSLRVTVTCANPTGLTEPELPSTNLVVNDVNLSSTQEIQVMAIPKSEFLPNDCNYEAVVVSVIDPNAGESGGSPAWLKVSSDNTKLSLL